MKADETKTFNALLKIDFDAVKQNDLDQTKSYQKFLRKEAPCLLNLNNVEVMSRLENLQKDCLSICEDFELLTKQDEVTGSDACNALSRLTDFLNEGLRPEKQFVYLAEEKQFKLVKVKNSDNVEKEDALDALENLLRKNLAEALFAGNIRRCTVCNSLFIHKRPDKFTCSDRCRNIKSCANRFGGQIVINVRG